MAEKLISMQPKQRGFFRSPIWPAILSAFVAPGVGQLANGDLSKGLFLLTTSVGTFFYFVHVMTERLSVLLPGTPDQWATNQQALRDAVKRLIEGDPNMFFTFQILMLLTWTFGIVDAYVTAKNPRPPSQPTSDEEDTDATD